MSGLIPQSFIDDLVARADIVEIINARVPLKRKGKEFMACCPFHSEKTPSFTVSESKQFYHCFGCGAHGTALGFLMQYENLEFVDAVEELASICHLEVPREQGSRQKQDDRGPLYDVIEQCNRLYQQELKTSPRAIDYLKQRGLTGEVAKHYQLGYAPEGWDFLTGKLDTDSRIEALVKTGMLIRKDGGGCYDRFRDRIMFAITDRRGRVIGFGGRILDKGEPKYLNSPENALFHKGTEVYGLYEAKRATRELERMVVVEGYMDVVALAQFGISYAVASLGTATTKEQIQTIFRSCPEIVFCYDGDMAGRKAAWRALQNTLEVIHDGQHARFLFLPDGEDPDSLVRKEGKAAFETRLMQATSLSDFLFEQLAQDHDITLAEGRSGLVQDATPLLRRMPESLFRDLLFDGLAELCKIPVERLQRSTGQDGDSAPAPARPAQGGRQQAAPRGLRNALALLLQYPELAGEIELDAALQASGTRGLPLLYELYLAARDGIGLSSAALLERFRDHADFDALIKLHHYAVPGSSDSDTRRALYADSVRHVSAHMVEAGRHARLAELEARVNEQGPSALSDAEKKEYNDLVSSR